MFCVELCCFGPDFSMEDKKLNSPDEVRLCQTKNGSRNSKMQEGEIHLPRTAGRRAFITAQIEGN
jgi:hypothetical protein